MMALCINPLLNDPDAVFVYSKPVPEKPGHDDYSRLAYETLALMQVELHGEKAVINPTRLQASILPIQKTGSPPIRHL